MSDMSEHARGELFRLVECTVHPLRASLSRKLRIRTELFAHLGTIYEDELQKLGNEQAALAQARARFGDPTELSRETQKSLPRSEPLRYFLEKQRWEPGESIWHFLGKHLLSAAVVWGGGLLLTILLMLMAPETQITDLRLSVQMILSMAVVLTAFSTTIVLSLTQLSRALHGKDSIKARRQAALCGGAVFVLIPSLLVLLGWTLMLSNVGLPLLGNLGLPYKMILAVCCVTSLTVSLFLLISRQVTDEMRYDEELAQLKTVD